MFAGPLLQHGGCIATITFVKGEGSLYVRKKVRSGTGVNATKRWMEDSGDPDSR